MKYNEVKNLIDFCNDNDIDRDNISDIAENIDNGETDFYTSDNNYRFLHSDDIDDIQKEELSNDTYILGCFNACFLADTCGIDIEAVEALQKAEAFDGLGKLMLPYIDDIQEGYSSADGYGHHFAHYDHETLEFGDYFVFRVN